MKNMKSFKRNISRLIQTIKTLAMVAVVGMTSSCEDFLTIYPTDKVVMENYWKTKTDVENVVANSYRLMVEPGFTDRLIAWGELRADNVVEGTYPSGFGNEENIMEANLLPQNGYNDWSHFYSIINNCNIVLNFAPGVLDEDPDFTEGDLSVTRGEMLAIRALCHFYLVRAFRDIPLLDEAKIDDDQELYQPQATPLQAMDFILADLYEAESLVMETGNYPSLADNKGRITKNAVRAIIADALLWKAAFTQYEQKGYTQDVKQCYTECIAFCDSALNSQMKFAKKYEEDNKVTYQGKVDEKYPIVHHPLKNTGNATTLDLPYTEVFDRGNSVRESIFELQLTSIKEGANYTIPYFYGNGFKVGPLTAPRFMAEIGTQSLFKETDYRRVSNMWMGGTGDVDKFPIIKYTYSSASGTVDKPSYPTSNSYITTKNDDNDRYYFITSTNWILYRTTDVMLMKAEALAHRNDTTMAGNKDLQNAFDLVKAVYYRSNPYKVVNADSIRYTTGNAESLQALVLEERQRELAFEGKRWFDLVRKALRDGDTSPMLDIMIDHKYETNQKAIRSKMASMDCMFFPISEREVKTNPLLKQNPAYEEEDLYEKK